MPDKLKQICDYVWANSTVGTKIDYSRTKKTDLISWKIQNILCVIYQFPAEFTKESDPERLASIIAAASDIVEQIVGYSVVNDDLSNEFGVLYSTVRCYIPQDKWLIGNGVVVAELQTSKHGTITQEISIKSLEPVIKNIDNERIAAILHVAWDIVSEMYHNFTGRNPSRDDLYIF